MQTLFIKGKDKKGNKIMKTVHVVRSWQESSGRQIFLHMNGVYGYKDGAPVKDTTDFSLIGDDFQRQRAETWWKRTGKKLSEEFYAALQRDQAELQKDIMPIEGDNSDLDSVTYRRRLIKDRRRIAFSPPATWFELFSIRPEWWGHATVIEIGEFRFERVEPGDPEEHPDTEETTDEPEKKSGAGGIAGEPGPGLERTAKGTFKKNPPKTGNLNKTGF